MRQEEVRASRAGRPGDDALTSSVSRARTVTSGPRGSRESLPQTGTQLRRCGETRDVYAFDTEQHWEVAKHHQNSSM